jgi:hypothetical protein
MMTPLDRPSTPSLSISTAHAVQAADSTRVLIPVMWLLIGLVFVVVGAYAALCNPLDPVPHQLEIRPDPDFHPLPPPAPVGPIPPDAEMIASAR